jgi:hypothetical protein
MRCVRVSGLGQWEGAMSLASLFTMTIALFAASHFWIGLRATLWPPPMGGLNTIGTAKRWVVLPIVRLVQRLHPLVSRSAYRCIPRARSV